MRFFCFLDTLYSLALGIYVDPAKRLYLLGRFYHFAYGSFQNDTTKAVRYSPRLRALDQGGTLRSRITSTARVLGAYNDKINKNAPITRSILYLFCSQNYSLSLRQAIPGRTLPSRYSRDAPPPVEMWVTLSAKPS